MNRSKTPGWRRRVGILASRDWLRMVQQALGFVEHLSRLFRILLAVLLPIHLPSSKPCTASPLDRSVSHRSSMKREVFPFTAYSRNRGRHDARDNDNDGALSRRSGWMAGHCIAPQSEPKRAWLLLNSVECPPARGTRMISMRECRLPRTQECLLWPAPTVVIF
jgi:hypothetical protein